MCRHLYLRNNRNMTLCRILHQFANIILRIKTALCMRVILFAIFAGILTEPPFLPDGFRPPGGKVGESRILLYFNPPACTISQMQMQTVEFIACQCIDLFLHKLLGTEMTGNIQHETPISKTGSIFHMCSLHFPRNFSGRLGQLQQCLQTIEKSGIRIRLN